MPLPCSLLKSTPKVPTTPGKAKRVSTFQEFESNTSDAWDAGEDDDELLAMAAQSLNTEVVMETAHRVLRNHSQRQGRPGPQEAPVPTLTAESEPPAGLTGDLRLVKSVSESHTSCAAGRGARGGAVQSGRAREGQGSASLWRGTRWFVPCVTLVRWGAACGSLGVWCAFLYPSKQSESPPPVVGGLWLSGVGCGGAGSHTHLFPALSPR